MVQFNVYNSERTVLNGKYTRRLLLFPDKVALALDIETISENLNLGDYDTASRYFYISNSYSKESFFAFKKILYSLKFYFSGFFCIEKE